LKKHEKNEFGGEEYKNLTYFLCVKKVLLRAVHVVALASLADPGCMKAACCSPKILIDQGILTILAGCKVKSVVLPLMLSADLRIRYEEAEKLAEHVMM